MVTATPRKTADERREQILDAALTEFADHGYEGASTDRIAREVGISQPYLFRLFGTKKGLYVASADALPRRHVRHVSCRLRRTGRRGGARGDGHGVQAD